ncbi:MAG: hypothetical protein K6A38_02210 [Lachnospiraceae bacterium]|nr:hypothetical protein [Lachnospiraceae bacterium]
MKTVKSITNGYGHEGRTGVPYYYKPVTKKSFKGNSNGMSFAQYEKEAVLNQKK